MNKQQHNHAMNSTEKKMALSLALVYAFRMLGLFMMLPVLAYYAAGLEHSKPVYVGLAVGIYGLTQALLQMPFGAMSDKYGRKRIIYFGLTLFALGSLLAAFAQSIYVLIAARALQGAGAIAAVVMALAADLSRDSQRAKVMAIIGVAIGASFLFSLMLGPLLHGYIGVKGLFILAFLFACTSFVIVAKLVPNPKQYSEYRQLRRADLSKVAFDRDLLRLDLSILLLHAIITALFVLIPFQLVNNWQLSVSAHWQLYFPVMLTSVLLAAPFIIKASRSNNAFNWLYLAVFALSCVAALSILFIDHKIIFALSLLAFFVLFNLLEAVIPALVSSLATRQHNSKGAALGVFSSAQFLGAFLGAVSAGFLLDSASMNLVAYILIAVGAIWSLLLKK